MPAPFETQLSSSEQNTLAIGRQLVQLAAAHIGQKPVIFALTGELGAGKTHMVKGMAQELGIQDLITSPSYTLVNEYEFRWDDAQLLFAHIDAWRLEQISHLESLGWSRFLRRNAVIALEWAPGGGNLPLQLPAHVVSVELKYGQLENDRLVTITVPEKNI